MQAQFSGSIAIVVSFAKKSIMVVGCLSVLLSCLEHFLLYRSVFIVSSFACLCWLVCILMGVFGAGCVR